MSTITADPTLLLVLSQMKEATEIRDSDGNLVGVYTPKALTVEDARKLFDLDKARARLNREKNQGRPFTAVMRRLKALQEEMGGQPERTPRRVAAGQKGPKPKKATRPG